MIIIGLTGPSGAGKGVVSEILREKHGFHTIDADKVYHTLVSSSSKCLDEIKEHFGENVIARDGSLDRCALREKVFGKENTERLELLNKITHKHVLNSIREEISTLDSKIFGCVVDAPLLIESGFAGECDFTISVLADESVRAKRISQRDGLSVSDSMKRIRSQKADDYYVQNTDYLIVNDGDLSSLEPLISKILNERGLSI